MDETTLNEVIAVLNDYLENVENTFGKESHAVQIAQGAIDFVKEQLF